jgi:hypothetical protein
MNKVQYFLKTYNADGQETFRMPFFIEKDSCYRTILLKMIDQLRDFNLDIDANKLRVVIGKNNNPQELYITLEAND